MSLWFELATVVNAELAYDRSTRLELHILSGWLMAMDRPVSSWHPRQDGVSTHAQRVLTKQRMELPSSESSDIYNDML